MNNFVAVGNIFIFLFFQKHSNHETTIVYGNYSNFQGTHYVNGLVQNGEEQHIVGNFYIDIPRKDTNLVINFTPGTRKLQILNIY